MWRSKKFIIVTLLAIVVLVGSTAGVVFAQTENGDESLPEARHEALLDRVCEIYEENTGDPIDPQVLRDAFTQAQSEMRAEAQDKFRQRLIDEGKITQEQIDQFETWLESRPDVPFAPGPRSHGGMHRGFGAFGSGFRGFGGLCAPQDS